MTALGGFISERPKTGSPRNWGPGIPEWGIRGKMNAIPG